MAMFRADFLGSVLRVNSCSVLWADSWWGSDGEPKLGQPRASQMLDPFCISLSLSFLKKANNKAKQNKTFFGFLVEITPIFIPTARETQSQPGSRFSWGLCCLLWALFLYRPCPVCCSPESNIDTGDLWVGGKDSFWEADWPSLLTPQFQGSQHAWVHAELAMMRMFSCRIGASLLLALGIFWPRASPCGISTHIEIGECSSVLVAGLGCVCMCGPSTGMASQ